jgi:hypothetical protein
MMHIFVKSYKFVVGFVCFQKGTHVYIQSVYFVYTIGKVPILYINLPQK